MLSNVTLSMRLVDREIASVSWILWTVNCTGEGIKLSLSATDVNNFFHIKMR